MWKTEFYETENKKKPVLEFLNSLSKKMRAKAYREIKILEKYGVYLREPYAKPIQGAKNKGLFELRIKFASDITRIFYFTYHSNTFVLLHGFVKKTDEIPPNEIEKARNRMKDYISRRKEK